LVGVVGVVKGPVLFPIVRFLALRGGAIVLGAEPLGTRPIVRGAVAVDEGEAIFALRTDVPTKAHAWSSVVGPRDLRIGAHPQDPAASLLPEAPLVVPFSGSFGGEAEAPGVIPVVEAVEMDRLVTQAEGRLHEPSERIRVIRAPPHGELERLV